MSKYCVALLAAVASTAGPEIARSQRPTDSAVISLAGSMARTSQSGRPRGAVTYTIDSTEIMSSSARTLSEVIEARVPGLSVFQSGGVAAQGAQIRSRGVRSFYTPSDPILIVDGMRMDATQDATVVALGVSSSRIDDIAPEDIARIDVLPGAAAANIYGPGASGGALVITTKRGGAPGLHFASRMQSGIGMIATRFPANYELLGVTSTGQTVQCPLVDAAVGQCTPTTLASWNPLEKRSPFRTARNAGGAFSIDGSVRQTSAYLSATGNRTLGVTGDDDAGRFGARANVTQHVGHSFNIAGYGSYLGSSAGLPPRGNVFENGNVIADGLFGPAFQDSTQDYRWTVGQTSTRERVHHWTGGVTANGSVFGLLYVSGDYGRDNVAEFDSRRGDRGYATGPSIELGNFRHSLTTIALSARTADWSLLSPSLRTRTVIGYDQLRSMMKAHDSLGLVTNPDLFSSAGLSVEPRIAGRSVRQEIAWGDRLSVGAGMRWEHWAHGAVRNFFRSGDLSWLVGRALHLDSLRLRAAYGEAINWTPGMPQWVGNPNGGPAINPMFLLPVERVKESEIGADFAVADRARFSLTAFRDDASHLYAFQLVTPGFGPPPSINDGALRNVGVELASQVRMLHTRWVQWDATVRASTLRERTQSIGPYPGSLYASPSTIDMRGSPVNGYVMQPYTYTDANHDGLISPNEVQLLNVPPTVVGTSLPTREASLLSTWSFLRGLSLSALVDYRGRQKLSDLNEAYRCVYVQNCRAVNDPSTPLSEQAQALVAYMPRLPYSQGASFTKLRELSVRWIVSSRFARWFGSNTAITVAGRNLATWTRYRGLDPELNSQPVSILPRVDLAETPIPREFLVRFDVGR